jgi:hyperosmotically inducible periplasmic protein
MVAMGSSTAAEARQVNAVKDGWIVMKIHSMFVPEDALSGSNIDVDVDHGVVTLKGTVPNETARAKAMQIAKGTDGVKGVTDQMRVAPAKEGKIEKAEDKTVDATKKVGHETASVAKKTGRAIDDGWIKSKIYTQYMTEWKTVLDDSDIDIDVDNNVVTLNGTVKDATARSKAVSIARKTDGVKSVKDNLRISATSK